MERYFSQIFVGCKIIVITKVSSVMDSLRFVFYKSLIMNVFVGFVIVFKIKMRMARRYCSSLVMKDIDILCALICT